MGEEVVDGEPDRLPGLGLLQPGRRVLGVVQYLECGKNCLNRPRGRTFPLPSGVDQLTYFLFCKGSGLEAN